MTSDMYTASEIFKGVDSFEDAMLALSTHKIVLPYLPHDVSEASMSSFIQNFKNRANQNPLSVPIKWETEDYSLRSIYFHLNEFYILYGVLKKILDKGIPSGKLQTFENKILQVVMDFCSYDLFDAKKYSKSNIRFRWNDMATGNRVAIISYILQRVAQQGREYINEFKTISIFLRNHYEYLIDEQLWSSHSNHGLFQSYGLFNLGIFPLFRFADQARETAKERILHYFFNSLSKEGIHLEHSPGYHEFINKLLGKTLDFNFFTPQEQTYIFLDRLLKTSQFAYSWFVQPDNTLAPLGDTSRNRKPASKIFPQEGLHPAPESGYGFFKKKHQCYFIFYAAFNSRMHKHLDDLSFILWFKDIEVCTETGMYSFAGGTPDEDLKKKGFYYDDPKRIFSELSRAHNTIEIDEEPDSRLNEDIYGSGIKNIQIQEDGLVYMEGEINRHSGFIHNRKLKLNPQGWLIVVDTLDQTKAENGEEHIFDQWFTFSPTLKISPTDGPEILALKTPEQSETIHVYSLTGADADIYFGQEEPFLAGFICANSTTLEPAPALRLRQRGTEKSIFVTLITLVKSKSVPEVDKAGIDLVCKWQTENENWEIKI
ncbi:heparinase II/III family protein [Maridesulfovibrio sp.]|uniref:heparinase II/III domain-containing protein n=1 Tax=Maridesulfovibrio sp. TaxID=2795000 RepID=UPI0039F136D8